MGSRFDKTAHVELVAMANVYKTGGVEISMGSILNMSLTFGHEEARKKKGCRCQVLPGNRESSFRPFSRNTSVELKVGGIHLTTPPV